MGDMETSLPHSIASAWASAIRSPGGPLRPRESLDRGEEDPGPSSALLARWGMAAPAWLLVEGEPGTWPRLAERLRPRFLAARVRTLAALGALEEAAGILAGEGVDLLVTQGAALLDSVDLPHPELRNMVDADVVVPPHQAERARRILLGCGFRALDGSGRLTRRGGTLDLHARPLGMERILRRRLALPLDDAEVWEEARPADPDGPLPPPTRVPSLPWLWVLTLAHAQKHSFGSLKWPLDLLLIGERMDPAGRRRAAYWARRLRLETSWIVMGGILEGWGAPLPPGLRPGGERISPGQQRLVRAASERLRGLGPMGWVGERMLWTMARGPWDRTLLVWETLFPGRATMRTLYPSYRPLLRPFYLLRRLWDLGRRLLGSRSDDLS
ncbi:MAG: nucleotidyltransferase family protein [bacterium]